MTNDEKRVWKLLEELAKDQKEFAKGQKELKESQERTDRQMKESQKELKESQERTDRQMKESQKGLRESQKELRESQKETDRQMKETDRQMKETDRRMGKWINGWGSFVEGLALPSIPEVFKKFDINIRETSLDRSRPLNGKHIEIDILAVGERDSGKNVVVPVEMKSRLSVSDVKDFIDKTLSNFSEFFTEYKGWEVIGAVGGVRIDAGVVDYAEKRGLYVLAPSGDVMVAMNSKDFKPKVWNGVE